MANSSMFTIKQGDTLPKLVETLYNADGTHIDLSTASDVRLHLRRRNDVLDLLGVVEDAVGGVVSHTWSSVETDQVGTFIREWQITFASGAVITVPNDREGYEVIVEQQIA